MSAYPLHDVPLFPALPWWREAALYADRGVMLYGGVELRKISKVARYDIATANGILQLAVPVKGGRWQAGLLRDAEIDYTHHWQRRHWGALFSAYGRAPYYEHYASALKDLLHAGYRRLWELNIAAILWLNEEMRTGIPFTVQDGVLDDEVLKIAREERHADPAPPKPYAQVFSARWPFLPGLSAIDLLMAEGPYATRFL